MVMSWRNDSGNQAPAGGASGSAPVGLHQFAMWYRRSMRDRSTNQLTSSVTAVTALLDRYPPELTLSDHDGAGTAHIHFARNGPPRQWIGESIAAALAHVATRDPGLTLGQCAAERCVGAAAKHGMALFTRASTRTGRRRR